MASAAARRRELIWAATVGIVLADSSVVTLGLPDILARFDTTVSGVAWVLTSFNLLLALAVLPAVVWTSRRGAGGRAVWAGGWRCSPRVAGVRARAVDAGVLIAGRCVQALGGACVLAGAIELLARSRGSHARAAPAWGAAALVGLAVGPAVGGLLTELISWQAIFAVQVPVVLLAAVAARPPRRPGGAGAARSAEPRA